MDQVPNSNDGADDHTDTVVCGEAVVKDCGGALLAGWHGGVGVGLLEGEVETVEGHWGGHKPSYEGTDEKKINK